MALPSYYTPVKPYKAPPVGGQTVQSQLYSALAAGNARLGTPPKPSDMIYGVEQADATNPSNTVYTPYQQAAPVAAVDPNTHQAPAAASSGGGGGGGGGGFGLAGFEEDPILAKTRALWARNVTQAEAAALAGRKQAEIGYGYDPNYTYADQPTQQAAQQNAFSDLANLLYQHTERAHNLDESLNKGNLFYSGERGVQLGREGRQYTLEQTMANQGFQSKLAGIANALMQTRLQAQDAELQAQENAYNRAVQFAMQYGTGFPGGGGGGGGGGGSNFYAPINPTGVSDQDIAAAAAAVAPTYNGQKFVPGQLMHEGQVTTENGRPGVYVKMVDPTGRQAGDTVFVPIG